MPDPEVSAAVPNEALREFIQDEIRPIKALADELADERDAAVRKVSTLEASIKDLRKEKSSLDSWSREIKSVQEKRKFKTAADKRAVGYLLDESFDIKDLKTEIEKISPDNFVSQFTNF